MNKHDVPVDTKDATTTPKPVISTSIINLFDPQLAKSRCTHDARFNCHIESSRRERVLNWIWGQFFIGKDAVDGLELGVSCGLPRRSEIWDVNDTDRLGDELYAHYGVRWFDYVLWR